VQAIFRGWPAICLTHRTWHMQPWPVDQSGYMHLARQCCLVALPWPGSAAWLHSPGPAVLLGCTPLARQCCLVALPWPGSAAWLHTPGPAVLLGCIPLARQCCMVAPPWPKLLCVSNCFAASESFCERKRPSSCCECSWKCSKTSRRGMSKIVVF